MLGTKAHFQPQVRGRRRGQTQMGTPMLPSPLALLPVVATSLDLEKILLGDALLEAQRGQESSPRLQSKMVPTLVLEASELLPRPCFRVPKVISSSALVPPCTHMIPSFQKVPCPSGSHRGVGLRPPSLLSLQEVTAWIILSTLEFWSHCNV